MNILVQKGENYFKVKIMHVRRDVSNDKMKVVRSTVRLWESGARGPVKSRHVAFLLIKFWSMELLIAPNADRARRFPPANAAFRR